MKKTLLIVFLLLLIGLSAVSILGDTDSSETEEEFISRKEQKDEMLLDNQETTDPMSHVSPAPRDEADIEGQQELEEIDDSLE